MSWFGTSVSEPYATTDWITGSFAYRRRDVVAIILSLYSCNDGYVYLMKRDSKSFEEQEIAEHTGKIMVSHVACSMLHLASRISNFNDIVPTTASYLFVFF
jgi:hypothetical protein